MNRLLAAGVVAFALVLFTFGSTARAVNYQFTGTIDAVLGTPTAPFDGIMAGDTWTISVEVNDAAPDQNADAAAGAYLLSNFTLTINGAMQSTTIGSVSVSNGPDDDSFSVLASLPTPVPTYSVGLSLVDSSETVYNADALPATVNPADFDIDVFSISGLTGAFTVTGSTHVPMPASIAPLMIGALAILRRRR